MENKLGLLLPPQARGVEIKFCSSAESLPMTQSFAVCAAAPAKISQEASPVPQQPQVYRMKWKRPSSKAGAADAGV